MNFGLVSRLLSVVLIIIALAFALCLCASIFLDEDIDQNLTTAAFGVSLATAPALGGHPILDRAKSYSTFLSP